MSSRCLPPATHCPRALSLSVQAWSTRVCAVCDRPCLLWRRRQQLVPVRAQREPDSLGGSRKLETWTHDDGCLTLDARCSTFTVSVAPFDLHPWPRLHP